MVNSLKTPPIFNALPSIREWENGRREEILQLFSTQVFGITPNQSEYTASFSHDCCSEQLAGVNALRKDICAHIKTVHGEHSFPFSLHIPKGVEKPPVILFLSIWDNDTVDPTGEKPSVKIPIPFLLNSGYAVAVLAVSGVDTDCDDGFVNGIESIFIPPHDRTEAAFSTIGAWAFGASRMLDYLLSDNSVNGEKTIIAGHSRGGKTALWAAAQDSRFWGVISNNSGCTGAALSTQKAGEQISDINGFFPYWFCDNYKKYNNNEGLLPVDQHMLLASIAPRLLYVASADKDSWADPKSEYESLQLAKEVYNLYNASDKTAYHLREGGHDITPYDWERFVEFFNPKQASI